MNFKLIVQYDGTDFHGWQIQSELRTVQGELTGALSLIDGREVLVHGSGRTDAGVHAEGQVASVFINRQITKEKLRAATNANIRSDVRVLEVNPVDETFHARYSAIEKTYVYRVLNGPVASPFWCRFALHEARELEAAAMEGAARGFVGEHDWTAFSAAQSDVDSRVRTITGLSVRARVDERAQSRLLEISVSADGFLRYMVRSIAGALLAIGRGELDEESLKRAIESGERPRAIVTAPPHGLTLLSVRY
ncbi:MAG TPA: tRNA pseudouridine(38-40) synthase TruA [Pyrinomonadaceae bacterium]|nr:tRNA pseudouridine(38-40) synthase TruA [Pyrinomonadaceae bacterium]